MSFVHRYEEDTSRPTAGAAAQDLARRTLAPAGLWWVVVVAVGLVIEGPLRSIPAEDEINQDLAGSRTSVMNLLTQVWSNIGGTLFIIASCLVAVAVLVWRTRQWWLAVVAPIAVAVQALVFVTSALVVGRDRPEVEPLDVSPPTSGYPSGHVGASTAFYLTLALLAQRIRSTALRNAATVLCFLVPALVAYSRLYRGMHHLSDVVVGLLNGIVCAWLAWRYLRRSDDGAASGGRRGGGAEASVPGVAGTTR